MSTIADASAIDIPITSLVDKYMLVSFRLMDLQVSVEVTLSRERSETGGYCPLSLLPYAVIVCTSN